MEYVINPLYWSLLYKPDEFDPYTFHSYIGPYMNHFVPWFLLNIEWYLNGFHFNSPQTLYLIISKGFLYLFVNYLGSLSLGRPVYYFLNYENYKSAIIIINILFLKSFIYLALSWLTNLLKSDHY